MFQGLWESIITKNGEESEWQPESGPTGYLDQESEMPEGPAFIAGTIPDGRKWLMFLIEEDNGTSIPCVIFERYNNQLEPKVMAFRGCCSFPNGGSPIVREDTIGGKNIKILIEGGKVSNKKGKKWFLTEEGKNFWNNKSTNDQEELRSIIKAQQVEIERLQQLVRQNRLSGSSENKSKESAVAVSKKKEELASK
jgi:hypothetical protein